MSSEDRTTEAPQVAEYSAAERVSDRDDSSSEDNDDGTYTMSQSLFDALATRGFSENAIKKSIVAGCINEATCTQWIQMHEGYPELDTALDEGVKVIIKAKRVLTEAEREAKVRELQERVRLRKDEEKLELQRKERERLEMSRKMARMKNEMDDVRRKLHVEEARREKAADLEARRRVKIQIAADRLERKGHTKAEALALATKEFEEAAQRERASAAERMEILQEIQASGQTATSLDDTTWSLSAITTGSSIENKLASLFEGDAPISAQGLLDSMHRRSLAEQTKECLRTLRLIIGNIVADPLDTKKRTLRTSTKVFRETILPVDEALQLLRWCGFDLSSDSANDQTLCLSTVVVRRLKQALALLGDA